PGRAGAGVVPRPAGGRCSRATAHAARAVATRSPIRRGATMAKPFDATMRDLVEIEPAAWLRLLELPVPDPAAARVIDSNLATVSPETDKLVRVGGPEPFLFHPEFLSGRAVGYPGHLLWYNVVAGHRHGLPMLSVLILLRRAADGPELTGEHEGQVP